MLELNFEKRNFKLVNFFLYNWIKFFRQKVVKTTLNHCQTTKSCQDVCFYDYKPVCGSDGRIYQSKCQMKVKNCG